MTRIRFDADVVLLHDCPQSCLPNPVESLLEVYEDMVEALLVLKIFLIEDSWVEDLLCGAPSCTEAGLFLSDDLLNMFIMIFSMTAWVTDEADCSVVLLPLQVAFLGKCND